MFFMIPAFLTPNHAFKELISLELINFNEKVEWFIRFLIRTVKTIIIAFNPTFIHIELHLLFS